MRKIFTDHLGNTYNTLNEMCVRYNTTPVMYHYRLRQGASIKEALLGTEKECRYYDHLGNGYTSLKAMCRKYGISIPAYKNRIDNGFTLEQALTLDKFESRVKKCYKRGPAYDHKGKEYPNIKEMCAAYGITQNRYYSGIKAGWSLEKILTQKIKKDGRSGEGKYTDHLGNKFTSVSAMCRHWGISDYLYCSRIEKGWSIEDTLTRPAFDKKIVDHLGNEFKTLEERNQYWGVKESTYFRKKHKGMSFKEIVESANKCYTNRIECTDHLGNHFDSVQAMCDHWHVNPGSYYSRIDQGMTIEEALTKPSCRNSKVKDHLGNEYRSVPEMCGKYGIKQATFFMRRRLGWTLEDALTRSSRDFPDYRVNFKE